jgi:glycosyltransferase involved in cell wall biosynthesis
MSSAHTPYDVRIFQKECQTLAEAGYDVTYVVQGPADAERNKVKFVTVPAASGRKSRMLKTTRQVLREAIRLNADIYHFHDPELIPAGLLLRLRGKKVVYDVHEEVANDILHKKWLPAPLRFAVAFATNAIQKFGAACFSGIVVSRPSLEKDFPKKKTALVNNYPILGELEMPASVPFDQRPRRAAYVGVMGCERGMREMVEGLGALPEDYDFELLIAGEVRPSGLVDEVRDLPGFRRVKLLGQQSRKQVAELLNSSRFGIIFFLPVPNHVRSFPTKLFEYISAGIPALATDMPLWIDIVEKGGFGKVVDINNPKAVADKIMWMTDHPDECRAMGERGRQAVQTEFNWGVEAARLLKLYERILA